MSIFEEDELAFEIEFLEGILRERPEQVDVLRALGHAYTKHGLHEQGLHMDERLAALRPREPEVRYNLACSYSLVGRISESIRTLQRAIDLGYDDFAHMSTDDDLANVREDPRYRVLMKRVLGKAHKSRGRG